MSTLRPATILLICAGTVLFLPQVHSVRGQATTNLPSPRIEPLRAYLPVPPLAFDAIMKLEQGPHVEPMHSTVRTPPLAPEGVTILSVGAAVTSSDTSPISGKLAAVTDGVKGHQERTNAVILQPGVQWVQIDLGASRAIYAIFLWHVIWPHICSHSVVVQVSDDAEFKSGVRTLFNNDYRNAAGLGIGQDLEYYESFEGKLVQANGQRARYVRLHSNGSSNGFKDNPYAFVDVYGLP